MITMIGCFSTHSVLLIAILEAEVMIILRNHEGSN